MGGFADLITWRPPRERELEEQLRGLTEENRSLAAELEQWHERANKEIADLRDKLNEARRVAGTMQMTVELLREQLGDARHERDWLREQVMNAYGTADRYHAEAVAHAREAPPELPRRPAWAGPEPDPLAEEIEDAIRKRAQNDSEAEELRATAYRRRDAENWKTDGIVAEIMNGAEIDIEMEAL